MAQTENDITEHLYKVVVVGDIGSGKTLLIKRYVHNMISNMHYKSTIGVDFALKVIPWDGKTEVRLQLWDIAGQERFGNMSRVYYKDAVGAIVVCDKARQASLNSVSLWKQDLDGEVVAFGKQIPVILLANKIYETEDDKGANMYSTQLDAITRDHGFLKWFEVGPKNNDNLNEAVRLLVQQIMDNEARYKKTYEPPVEQFEVEKSQENKQPSFLDKILK